MTRTPKTKTLKISENRETGSTILDRIDAWANHKGIKSREDAARMLLDIALKQWEGEAFYREMGVKGFQK